MNYNDVHESDQYILLRGISGSRAYGLQTASSDTDIRGVFVATKELFYGLNPIEQFNNDSSDIVYYELKKFIGLLARNNPNIMELLCLPDDCILYKHPFLTKIKIEDFLNRTAGISFGRYAFAQIEKARGLNKKIVNPMEPERKGLLDFCWVSDGQGSVSLKAWLAQHHIQSTSCGCIAINHMKNCYHLFVGDAYKGITDKDDVQILLSSVSKEEKPIVMFYCNTEGFQKYCVEYNEYWKWVENRNQARYESTMQHGKNYDAKNMMHTFRLLSMALEIATEKKIITRRPDREFLLSIRNGEFEYDELVEMAKMKMSQVDEAFLHSDLPEKPDFDKADELLLELREEWYKK